MTKPSTIIAMILSFSVFCAGVTLFVHNRLDKMNKETAVHTLYEYDLSEKKSSTFTEGMEPEESTAPEESILAKVQTRLFRRRYGQADKQNTFTHGNTTAEVGTTTPSESGTSSATASTTDSTTGSTTKSTTGSTTESKTESTTGSTTKSTTKPEEQKYYYWVDEKEKEFHWAGVNKPSAPPYGTDWTLYYGTYTELVEKGYTPCPICFP